MIHGVMARYEVKYAVFSCISYNSRRESGIRTYMGFKFYLCGVVGCSKIISISKQLLPS